MHIDRTRARNAFDVYVADYDIADPKIRLKVDHTYRVADLCDEIARELGWSNDDVDLAWLCGLLHDIGRFEQVRRYGTFKDSESVSHATLGAQILFGTGDGAGDGTDGNSDGIIRRFADAPDEDALIRSTVAEHSDYQLPSNLNKRTRQFCEVVRDADQIDIVKVNCIESAESIYGVSESELEASPVSSQALAGFHEHRTLRRDERTYPADYVVSHICFAFDLVYPISRHIMEKQGYLDKMLTRPFTNEQTTKIFADMRKEMHAWLEMQSH